MNLRAEETRNLEMALQKAKAHRLYVDGAHPKTIAEVVHVSKKLLAKWMDEWEGGMGAKS